MKKITLFSLLLGAAGFPLSADMGCPVAYSPSVMCSEPCGQFYAEADFLYWYATESNFAPYVQTRTFTPATAGTDFTTDVFTETKDWSSKWKPGFRVALGWRPACQTWDTRLSYVYFNAKESIGPTTGLSGQTVVGTGTAVDETTDFAQPTFQPGYNLDALDLITGTDDSFLSVAGSQWDLRLNQLDWQIGRDYRISHDVSLRPYTGIRGIQGRQTLHTDILFDGTLNLGTTGTFLDDNYLSDFSWKDNFWGLGLMGGMEGTYDLGCGFGIWGNFGGGLLWTHHETEGTTLLINTQDFDGPGTVGTVVTLQERQKNKRDVDVAMLNLDLSLALSWDWSFDCDRQHFGVKLGWESHLYTEFNQLGLYGLGEATSKGTDVLPFANTVNGSNAISGNLGVQGAFLRASWFF